MKDNIPRDRFPLATVALVAIDSAAYALYSHHGGLPSILLDILFLVLFGPSVEEALGRLRFCAFCLLAGLIALGAGGLAGDDLPAPLLLAAAGAIAAVLGGYLPLHPRARVLMLVPLPFFMTIVELPAALFLGIWLLAQACLGAFGLEHYLGPAGVSYAVDIGGFAVGLLLMGLFAKRRAPLPPHLQVY